MRWLALLLLVGCAPEEEAPEPQIALISEMQFAVEDEPGVSVGFDLDGAESTEGGATGCGIADYTSPDGRTGIDNSFAPLVPALETVGGDALQPLVQQSIDSGELLVLIEMLGLDDPMDDECVGLHVAQGIGPPSLGTDGFILPGQTYERDLDAPDTDVECAVLASGRLRAEPFSMRLPLAIFDEFVDFHLRDGVLEMERNDDGTYSGVFGGGIETSELVANVNGLDAIPEGIFSLIETAATTRADLEPNNQGFCQRLSVTFAFEGVSAYLFD